MAIVRKTTVEAVTSHQAFDALMSEYTTEAKIAEMPQPMVNIAGYKQMEAMGMYHAFAAYSDDELVGFLGMVVADVPHYSARIATAESLFVSSMHRKGGTGIKLIRAAEECATEHGAAVLFITAPAGGRLKAFMPRVGYRESHSVFCRSLA